MRGQSATVNAFTVGATSPVTLLSAKVNRAGFYVYNEGGNLYVLCGPGTVSGSLYSFRLVANEGQPIDNYTGTITAIKASGSSTVMVTEFW